MQDPKKLFLDVNRKSPNASDRYQLTFSDKLGLPDCLVACSEAMPAATAKAPPVDLSHHYSRTTKNRQLSAIKGFYKYFQIPGIGNLAGGLFTLLEPMGFG